LLYKIKTCYSQQLYLHILLGTHDHQVKIDELINRTKKEKVKAQYIYV